MKLCLFETNDAPGERRLGAVVDGGVAELTSVLGDTAALPPQARMEAVIDGFEGLRDAFERIIAGGASHADGSFRGRARYSAASATTGSTPNGSRARSTCS